MSDRLSLFKLHLMGDDVDLLTPHIQNQKLDHSTVPHEAGMSFHDSEVSSPSHGDDQGSSCFQNRLARLDKYLSTPVVSTPGSSFWTILLARSLVCATILASAGCGLWQSGPQEYTEDEKKAELDKLLAAYPAEPADTPEQTQKKEAEVEEKLPRVVAMLEELKTDPSKVDEVVETSMHLVSLAPKHRAANIVYCKAQLASFFAKEEGDRYDALVAITSAAREIERFREIFDDMSEDERKLFQEVYFNQARREGYYPDGEDALDVFKNAIENLMKMGFRDAERLRAEPKFAGFFTDPRFASVLKAAIAQIEGSATDDQPK